MKVSNSKYCQIAIDGYSRCGKTTLSLMLSKELNIPYVDSGTLYRLITFYLLQDRFTDKEQVFKMISEAHYLENNGKFHNTKDLFKYLRSDDVTNHVSLISQDVDIRNYVNKTIQENFFNKSVVMNGRDIGTVVLPNAQIRIFLKSSVERRIKIWKLNHNIEDIKAIKEMENSLRQRDYYDTHREIAPLKCDSDYIVFDRDEWRIENIVNYIVPLYYKECGIVV